MARKTAPTKYPQITAFKAFELLRRLDAGAANRDLSTHEQYRRLLNETQDALANHVLAAIQRGSK